MGYDTKILYVKYEANLKLGRGQGRGYYTNILRQNMRLI